MRSPTRRIVPDGTPLRSLGLGFDGFQNSLVLLGHPLFYGLRFVGREVHPLPCVGVWVEVV